MTTAPFVNDSIPDELVDLGIALGLISPPNGAPPQLNFCWFEDPGTFMAGALKDPVQRAALIDVAEALFNTATDGLDLTDIPDDETWIPLHRIGEGDTTMGLFAVVTVDAGTPQLGLGARVGIQAPGATAMVSIRVPIIRLHDDGPELILGTAGGVIDVAGSAFIDGVGVSGLVSLDGITAHIALPTVLSEEPDLSILLIGLQLPGDPAPRDVELSEVLDTLGPTGARILVSLLRAQTGLSSAVRDFLALIGLDDTGTIPPLPVADFVRDGYPALRPWLAEVAESALQPWLERLRSLLSLPTPVQGSGTVTDPLRVCLNDGNLSACLTIATDAVADSGGLTLIPGASVRLSGPAGGIPGRLAGDLRFCTIALHPNLQVIEGPRLQAHAQVGDGSLVKTPTVDVGSLRVGLSTTNAGQLGPLLEAHSVRVGDDDYEVLDLTSADALTEVASGSGAVDAVVGALLDALGIATNSEARSFATLAGLVEPSGAPTSWPQLTDVQHLVADPVGAIACYHARVLSQEDAWSHIAAELATLLRGGGITPTVTGTGTEADPWAIELFNNTASTDPVRGRVEMQAWTAVGAGGPTLHIALATSPELPTVDGKELDVGYVATLLRARLPATETCPAAVGLDWAPRHELRASLSPDLVMPVGAVILSADAVLLAARWDRDGSTGPRLVIANPRIAIDGNVASFPDFDLDWDPSATEFESLDWPTLQLGFGDVLDGLGDWWPRLGRLAGWELGDLDIQLPRLPDLSISLPAGSFPSIDLGRLLIDPWDAILDWLKSLFGGGGSGFPDFSLPFIEWLADLFRLPALSGGGGPSVRVTGNGLYDDPWAIALGEGDFEFLLWLDPDGPSLAGFADLASHLLPDDLTGPLDGGTGDLPDLDGLVDLLERAAALVPDLADRVGDFADLRPGLGALRDRVSGDGFVSDAAQAAEGWSITHINEVSHLQEPASFTMPPALGSVHPSNQVFVTAPHPGVTDFPDLSIGTVIDLTEAGTRPEAFDLSAFTGPGPWFVLLPDQAGAVVPEEPGVAGLERLTARLARAVEHVRGIAGDDLVLIAHSVSGFAARHVAAQPKAATGIAAVVSVGTPHGGATFEFLDDPQVANAVRFLQRLRRMLDDTVADAPDLAPLTRLLDTLGSAIDPYLPNEDEDGILEFVGFPVNDFAVPESLPELGSGTQGHAVVGRLLPEAFQRRFAVLVRRALEAAIGLLPDGNPGSVTHLGLGVRARLATAETMAGAISIASDLRFDLHRIQLQTGTPPDKHPVPRLSVHAEMRRNGGWLAGGPDPTHVAGAPRDPRVRWAEAVLSVTATGGEPDADVRIVLHDAAVFGHIQDRWVIDESSLTETGEVATLLPEARILLGEITEALGEVPQGSEVRRLAELLETLALVNIESDDTITISPDPIERFLVDPLTELQARVTSSPDPEAALGTWLGVAPTGPLAIELGDSLELRLDLAEPSVAIAFIDFQLGDAIAIDGEAVAAVTGLERLSVTVGTVRDASPAGRVVLAASWDAGDPAPTITLESSGGTIDPFDGAIRLAPTVDSAALRGLAVRLIPGEVLRRVVEWVLEPGRLPASQGAGMRSALQRLGVTAEARVRNLAGVLDSSMEWLSHPDVLGSVTSDPLGVGGPALDPIKVAHVLDDARDLLGLTAPPGTLPLPWGVTAAISATGDTGAVSLGWGSPLIVGNVTLSGGVGLVMRPGIEVSPSVATRIGVTGSGLDHAAVEVAAATTVTVAVHIKPQGVDEVTIGLLPTVTGLEDLAALAVGAAIEAALPLALDAIADSGSSVGDAVADLGEALQLRRNGSFDATALRAFGNDPVTDLVTRLKNDAAAALSASQDLLSDTALLPGSINVVGSTLALDLGHGLSAQLEVPTTGPVSLCIGAQNLRPIPELRIDAELCFEPSGIERLHVIAEIDDPTLLAAGSVSMLPTVSFFIGAAAEQGLSRAELGLWVENPGADPRHGVFVIAPFTSGASATCRTVTGTIISETGVEDCVGALIRTWLLPLAAELVLDSPAMQPILDHAVQGGPSVGLVLRRAKLLVDAAGGGFDLAPGLFDDLARRMLLLAWATMDAFKDGISIGDLSISIETEIDGARCRYGVAIDIDDLELFREGGLRGVLVTEDWLVPGQDGLTIYFLSVNEAFLTDESQDPAPNFDAGVSIDGIGFRLDDPNGDNLLDTVATLKAVELHGSFELQNATPTRAAAGIQLRDFTLPIGRGSGGANLVAGKILSQGNEGSSAGDDEELAPALSPLLILRAVGSPTAELRFGVGDPPWWIPIQRSFGPIYVEQVGVDVEQNATVEAIKVLVDGGVSLEGLSIGVDDLSVRIPWEDGWNPETWSLDLLGLAVGYQGAGVTIAGGLRKAEVDNVISYDGMVQVDAYSFGLAAVGSYAAIADPTLSGATYTSLFVFVAIDSAIGGPPPFFVVGLGGGVGLNRRLALPAKVTDVPSFPLVAAMDSSSGFADDPMGVLRSIGQTFPPDRGVFWFAAGVRFTSFVLVESVAVLSVQLGDGVEVSLLGLSRTELPRPDYAIASIELALIARFSSEEGFLLVQAQLTDNSWLLSRDCRLTGGFAFAAWFRTGEFVLTLGGYHPNFPVPAHYPQVPRLGFHWTVSGAIVVKGECYFAITSSCVMGGGRLEVSYTTSTVWASFEAGIHGIVSWDPFFYDVEAYIRVSAGIRIRICFFKCFTLRKSFSIGAHVHVWGPELRGEATLELGPIDVTVGFGSSRQTDESALNWDVFVDKYLVQDNAQGEAMSVAITKGLLTPDPGMAEAPADGTAAHPWRVRPDFAFTTETRAATTKLEVSDALPEQSSGGPHVDLAPLKVTNVISVHRVLVRRDAPAADVTDQLDSDKIEASLPDGPWRYVRREERAPEAEMITSIVGASLVARMIVADDDIEVRLTMTQPSDIDHPLPFHVEKRQRTEFVNDVSAAQAYLDGQPTATADILVKATADIITLDTVEARVFGADRVAPPRLAPLTEGMVDAVKGAVPRQQRPIAEPVPPDRAPAPPIVMGILTGDVAPRARQIVETSVRTTMRRRKPVPRTSVPLLAETVDGGRSRLNAVLETAGVAPKGFRQTLRSPLPPETEVIGRHRELLNGFGVARKTRSRLNGIARRLANGGVELGPGNVTLLRIPNARFDERQTRPNLDVKGNQRLRVVVLDRAGNPIHDTTLLEGRVEMPLGTDRVALAGLGVSDNGNGDAGLSGWHSTTTLTQIDSNAYLAPGAVVISSAPKTYRRSSAMTLGQVTADRATAGPSVVTHLPASTEAVVIALDPYDAPSDMADAFRSITLGLDGAVRHRQEDGAVTPPEMVLSGSRVFAVYDVVPDGRSTNVVVSVVSDERWAIAGVAGAPGSASSVRDDIAAEGIETSLTGVANPAGTSIVKWTDPEPTGGFEGEDG